MSLHVYPVQHSHGADCQLHLLIVQFDPDPDLVFALDQCVHGQSWKRPLKRTKIDHDNLTSISRSSDLDHVRIEWPVMANHAHVGIWIAPSVGDGHRDTA